MGWGGAAAPPHTTARAPCTLRRPCTQQRWFELTEVALSYYLVVGPGATLCGQVPLKDIYSVHSDPAHAARFSILHASGQVYSFRADGEGAGVHATRPLHLCPLARGREAPCLAASAPALLARARPRGRLPCLSSRAEALPLVPGPSTAGDLEPPALPEVLPEAATRASLPQ